MTAEEEKEFQKLKQKLEKRKRGLGGDLMLILIGAVISFTVTVVTNYFNHIEENNKLIKEEKLKFYSDFSDNLGLLRASIIQCYFAKKLNDPLLLKQAKKKHDLFTTTMNAKNLSYNAQLAYYYHEDITSRFQNNVFNPIGEQWTSIYGNSLTPELEKEFKKNVEAMDDTVSLLYATILQKAHENEISFPLIGMLTNKE